MAETCQVQISRECDERVIEIYMIFHKSPHEFAILKELVGYICRPCLVELLAELNIRILKEKNLNTPQPSP